MLNSVCSVKANKRVVFTFYLLCNSDKRIVCFVIRIHLFSMNSFVFYAINPTLLISIHGINIASRISPVNNIANKISKNIIS